MGNAARNLVGNSAGNSVGTFCGTGCREKVFLRKAVIGGS